VVCRAPVIIAIKMRRGFAAAMRTLAAIGVGVGPSGLVAAGRVCRGASSGASGLLRGAIGGGAAACAGYFLCLNLWVAFPFIADRSLLAAWCVDFDAGGA